MSYLCNVLEALPKHKQLILFDGICNLCNSSILYVIKHDKTNRFMFAPLQSNAGQHIIESYNIDTSKTDSILLYSNENGLSVKSSAALKIAKHLGFPRNMMIVFFIIPTFIRNWVYDYVAKNRYRWYGKKEACMIPTPELKSKFLE
nr:DCC1-like thiol-disulfide oxidoreductase family protein [Psychroserpens algicola]